MTKRILIVEDDDDIASIEKDYLEVSGYEVHVEEDGAKGLSEALTGIYDLFLLDVMLPNMDGFEICRKLRDKTDKPIMLVTAKRGRYRQDPRPWLWGGRLHRKAVFPGVLVAKVKAQLAQYDRLKGTKKETKRITLGDIMLEPDTRRVWVDGKEKGTSEQGIPAP